MSFLRDSESTLKGKIRSRWNFLKICLSQQLFSFKKFCIKCHKVDHDDYRKVLQFTLLLLTLKKSASFLGTIEFLDTFDVQIDITFVICFGTFQNYTFQKDYISL